MAETLYDVARRIFDEHVEGREDELESVLDEKVHDAASRMASGINNAGIQTQIEYLLIDGGWSEESIVEVLKEVQ